MYFVRTAEGLEQVCQIILANSQCDNYNTILYWKGKPIRKIIVTSIFFLYLMVNTIYQERKIT